MKLLLTSGGVTNASIHEALVELLGKPVAESTALCIPTGMYGHPHVGPVHLHLSAHRYPRSERGLRRPSGSIY